MEKKKKIWLVTLLAIILISTFYLWGIGQDRKDKILSLTRNLDCVPIPALEILESTYAGNTDVLCLFEGESFSPNYIYQHTIPISGGKVDYLQYESQLYNSEFPVANLEFSCSSDTLDCGPNTVLAAADSRLSVSYTCNVVNSSFYIPEGVAPYLFTEAFDKVKVCDVQLKKVAEPTSFIWMCPIQKTGDLGRDLRSEIFCDAIEPYKQELMNLDKRYTGAIPIFLVFDSEEYLQPITEATAFLSMVNGIYQQMYQKETEIFSFEAGAISWFSDGTKSLDGHLSNLKSKAEKTYVDFKGDLGALPDYLISTTEGTTFDEYQGLKTSAQNAFVTHLKHQLDLIDEDERKGDLEKAILRAEYIVSAGKARGWMFSISDTEPDNTEIKYMTANCILWLGNQDLFDKADCGNYFLQPETTFSLDDLADFEELSNLSIVFEADEESAIFAPSYLAEFSDGTLIANNMVDVGIEVHYDGQQYHVIFGSQ